jgi:hypothetical protein
MDERVSAYIHVLEAELADMRTENETIKDVYYARVIGSKPPYLVYGNKRLPIQKLEICAWRSARGVLPDDGVRTLLDWLNIDEDFPVVHLRLDSTLRGRAIDIQPSRNSDRFSIGHFGGDAWYAYPITRDNAQRVVTDIVARFDDIPVVVQEADFDECFFTYTQYM